MEDVHRAGGIPALLGELNRGGALRTGVRSVHSPDLDELAGGLGHPQRQGDATRRWSSSTPRPAACAPPSRSPPRTDGPALDTDAVEGCIRSVEHAYTADGGLAILFGNLAPDGCVVKTAGVDEELWKFSGPARVFESQDDGGRRHPRQAGRRRRRGGHPLRGPARRSRHAGDALPDELPQGPRPGQGVRADHRRPVLRRHLRAVHRPRLPGGGVRRADRAGRDRRRDHHRHPRPQHHAERRRRGRWPSAGTSRSAGPSRTPRSTGSGRSRRRCAPTPRWPPARATAPTAGSRTEAGVRPTGSAKRNAQAAAATPGCRCTAGPLAAAGVKRMASAGGVPAGRPDRRREDHLLQACPRTGRGGPAVRGRADLHPARPVRHRLSGEAYVDLYGPALDEVRERAFGEVAQGHDVALDLGIWSRVDRDDWKRRLDGAGARWRLLYFPVSRSRVAASPGRAQPAGRRGFAARRESDLDDFYARFEEPMDEGEEVIQPGSY